MTTILCTYIYASLIPTSQFCVWHDHTHTPLRMMKCNKISLDVSFILHFVKVAQIMCLLLMHAQHNYPCVDPAAVRVVQYRRIRCVVARFWQMYHVMLYRSMAESTETFLVGQLKHLAGLCGLKPVVVEMRLRSSITCCVYVSGNIQDVLTEQTNISVLWLLCSEERTQALEWSSYCQRHLGLVFNLVVNIL